MGLLEKECGIVDPIDMGEEIGGPCPGQRVIDRTTKKPWHDFERRARHWSINKKTGKHWCFSCHYHGSLTGLVMDTTKKSMWDVLRIIRQYGMSIEELTSFDADEPEEAPRQKRLPASSFAGFVDPPLRALRRRRITPQAAEDLDIRWDPDRGAWILPIKTAAGDLIGYQIKAPDRVLNFPNKVRKSETLFGLHLFRGPRVTLVESPLDVAYLRGMGYEAVSSYGSGVSRKQMEYVLDYAKTLVLALDNDSSGVKATQQILREKWHMRIPTFIVTYDEIKGKDVGEMSIEEAAQSIEYAIPAALWSPPK
jgi:DNA primase